MYHDSQGREIEDAEDDNMRRDQQERLRDALANSKPEYALWELGYKVELDEGNSKLVPLATQDYVQDVINFLNRKEGAHWCGTGEEADDRLRELGYRLAYTGGTGPNDLNFTHVAVLHDPHKDDYLEDEQIGFTSEEADDLLHQFTKCYASLTMRKVQVEDERYMLTVSVTDDLQPLMLVHLDQIQQLTRMAGAMAQDDEVRQFEALLVVCVDCYQEIIESDAQRCEGGFVCVQCIKKSLERPTYFCSACHSNENLSLYHKPNVTNSNGWLCSNCADRLVDEYGLDLVEDNGKGDDEKPEPKPSNETEELKSFDFLPCCYLCHREEGERISIQLDSDVTAQICTDCLAVAVKQLANNKPWIEEHPF